MFAVRESTAESLFKAQKEKAQGRLRLDISSRNFPRNLREPIDLRAARGAIGERVVDMAYNAAAEAASLGADREAFKPDAVAALRGRRQPFAADAQQRQFRALRRTAVERVARPRPA